MSSTTDFVLPPLGGTQTDDSTLITDRFVALQAAPDANAVVFAGDADAGVLRIAPLAPGQALSSRPQGTSLKFDAEGACTVSTAFMVVTRGQVIKFVDGGVFSTTSDARLKTEVEPIHPADALSTVLRLHPVRYEWCDGRPTLAPGLPEVGLLAQEVREVLPSIVAEQEGTGTLSVAYDRLTAVLTGSLQELLAATQEVRAEVAALHDRVSTNHATVEAVTSTVAALGVLLG